MPCMKLVEFKSYFKNSALIDDAEISGLAYDGRLCRSGYLFFCKGSTFKAEYAVQAAKNGAAAVVCEECLYEAVGEALRDTPILICDDVMRAMADCAACFYGYPMKRLITVAVTGTKGKSTTVHYINSVLNAQGFKSAVLSSLVSSDAPRLTTPEAIDLHAAAYRAVEQGCTHLVCEISSQAQKVGRTLGIIFDYACFLNLGLDHISPSEHSNMAEYFECKRTLFDNCRTAVVNTDDLYGIKILKALPTATARITFSVSKGSAEYFAEKTEACGDGCCFTAVSGVGRRKIPLYIPTLGEHNVTNALCALAVTRALGVSELSVFLGISQGGPQGRGSVSCSRDGRVTVLVDYAHNEMSFDAMFKIAKTRFAGATVTVIFGCPGDKARCRRSQLARICADNADKVIISEDDSGNEGYEKISAELRAEFDALENRRLKGCAVSLIRDRKTALQTALKNASEDDKKHLILLLGKGDENVNRGCGCDEACISDEILAREAIEEYDKNSLLYDTVSGDEKTAVCIAQGGQTAALAEYVSRRKFAQKTSAVAVCGVDTAKQLSADCFVRGVSVLIISEDELFGQIKRVIKKVHTAHKMGFLPIFTSKASSELVITVAKALKYEKMVYIAESTGILFGGRFNVKSLPRSYLAKINRVFYDAELRIAEKSLKAGLKSVTFSSDNALSCLCGESEGGAVFYAD